jgi:hypothetical protein
MGCDSVRQATGVAKLPPDEFTVLTKPPLVLPPDYNLRPPQPGVASRNEPDPDDAGRTVLFPQNAATAAAALGAAYSDGEKLLLTKTNALNVDPNIRRSITGDAGQEDQGPAFCSVSSSREPVPHRRSLPPMFLLRRQHLPQRHGRCLRSFTKARALRLRRR